MKRTSVFVTIGFLAGLAVGFFAHSAGVGKLLRRDMHAADLEAIEKLHQDDIKFTLSQDKELMNIWSEDAASLTSASRPFSRLETEPSSTMLKQLRYFENNAPQMRYAEYREKKFFVGSGVVEAGCRTVIGERLKQSGMRWSVRGANAIIALRCCILSGRFEDFWASRAPWPPFYLVHPIPTENATAPRNGK